MTTTRTEPAESTWADTNSPVVVAVDGSERNLSAVHWAADEAAATGADLILVTAVENLLERPPRSYVNEAQRQAQAMLTELAESLETQVPRSRIHTVVELGSPEMVLLKRFHEPGVIVVGTRGLGAVSRLLVGSTSIALAGRSPVPLAVIPDSWSQAEHAGEPVVVGIDPYGDQERLVMLAAARAEARGVSLVAVHGWTGPIAYPFGPASMVVELKQWALQAHEEFEKLVASWRNRFPGLTIQSAHVDQPPSTAVLDAAEAGQAILLGRSASHRFVGLPIGSVTRVVLHHATCPVIVVPSV